MPLDARAGRARGRARSSATSSRSRRWCRRSRSTGRKLYELARAGEEVERPAAARAHRRARGRGVRAAAPYPEATIRVDCSSGTYIRTLAADLGAALGGCAHLGALRRAARRLVRARRGAHRSTRSRPIPTRVVLTPAAALRDLDDGASSTREQARAVAHGATFAAPALLGDARRRRARSRSSTKHGALLAVYERRGGGREAGRRARDGSGVTGSSEDLPRPRRGRRRTASGRVGHDRRVRRRAPRPPGRAAPRARARPGPRPLRRPCSPSTGTRPRSCGPSRRRSCSRRSTRSSSCSTRRAPSTSASCSRSTQTRSKEPAEAVRRASCSRARSRARLVVVGADFHFGYRRHGDVPLLQRMGAELGFETIGLGLVARRPTATRGVPVLVDPRPRAARGAATSRARPRSSAARTRCAARSSAATPAAASSASRPRTWRCPSTSACPPTACTPARSSAPTACERPAAISLGRRPTFYAEAGLLPARGVRARFRRRSLRPDAPGSGSTHRLRGQERFDDVDDLIAQMRSGRRARSASWPRAERARSSGSLRS